MAIFAPVGAWDPEMSDPVRNFPVFSIVRRRRWWYTLITVREEPTERKEGRKMMELLGMGIALIGIVALGGFAFLAGLLHR